MTFLSACGVDQLVGQITALALTRGFVLAEGWKELRQQQPELPHNAPVHSQQAPPDLHPHGSGP